MHILCSEKEYKAKSKFLSKLPLGTTVVVSDDSTGKSLRRMLLTVDGWKLEADFVELDREWNDDKERNGYSDQQTKQTVARYFIEYDEYENPQPKRFWQVMRVLEFKFFKHVQHGGQIYPSEKLSLKLPYNQFQVKIERQDDLNTVKAELLYILKLQKKRHPSLTWQSFKIFEHTLSAGGSYRLVSEGEKWTIELTRWGCTSEVYTGTMDDCLEFIQRNLWYGDDLEEQD